MASISIKEKETMESPRMEDSQEDDSIIVTFKFTSVASIFIEDTVKSQGMEGSIVRVYFFFSGLHFYRGEGDSGES